MRGLPPERNLVLIGFMGSGKTAVGSLLARNLGREFVDLDARIEAATGRTVAEIFRERDEQGFRAIEGRMVAEVARLTGCVVATGGGVVTDPANVAALRQSGLLVWLRASPETILARIGGTGHLRPLLNVPDPLARIRALLAEREPRYAEADLIVDTDGQDVEGVVAEIVRRLGDDAPGR